MSSETYVIGDTIRLKAEVRNFGNDLATPAGITVSVINDSGTIILAEVAPTRESEGIYIYDWTISGITDRSSLIVKWEYTDSDDVHIDVMRITVMPIYGG